MANKIFVVHLQTQTKRGSLGSLAQLVQSVCLTSRGSGVRLPQLPQRIKQLQKCSCFFRVRKSRKRGKADNPGDEIIQPNAPSRHVVADEITWEQYILKKCPCRQVERRFSSLPSFSVLRCQFFLCSRFAIRRRCNHFPYTSTLDSPSGTCRAHRVHRRVLRRQS